MIEYDRHVLLTKIARDNQGTSVNVISLYIMYYHVIPCHTTQCFELRQLSWLPHTAAAWRCHGISSLRPWISTQRTADPVGSVAEMRNASTCIDVCQETDHFEQLQSQRSQRSQNVLYKSYITVGGCIFALETFDPHSLD